MGVRKARVVIVGAGMAGLVAANRLHNAAGGSDVLEVAVVEAGDRIGGRIRTGRFCGDRVEFGATWIHGVGGSPVHRIAGEAGALDSPEPWERMDGFPADAVTVAEGGLVVDPATVDSVSALYRALMDAAKAGGGGGGEGEYSLLPELRPGSSDERSVGGYLRRGLAAALKVGPLGESGEGGWSRAAVEEAVFAMHENVERTYTSAGDLYELDLAAEAEYELLPGEEITIARGYSRVVEKIASGLPPGLVKLGKKVARIEWMLPDSDGRRPVNMHFDDGGSLAADHVIVTVSLGVLKSSSTELFRPSLPRFKSDAIGKLGFGVVNKLFLQVESESNESDDRDKETIFFPNLQMVFHPSSSVAEQQGTKVPWWMRKTASLCPIYKTSKVLLSWFAGEEALELETLKDDELKRGVAATLSNLAGDGSGSFAGARLGKVMSTRWGTDPLFMGSYSFVAVGSSGDDMDALAEPLPAAGGGAPAMQILFAGEATDRTHYSTTHGAYFSGLREANRLLKHYKL